MEINYAEFVKIISQVVVLHVKGQTTPIQCQQVLELSTFSFILWSNDTVWLSQCIQHSKQCIWGLVSAEYTDEALLLVCFSSVGCKHGCARTPMGVPSRANNFTSWKCCRSVFLAGLY